MTKPTLVQLCFRLSGKYLLEKKDLIIFNDAMDEYDRDMKELAYLRARTTWHPIKNAPIGERVLLKGKITGAPFIDVISSTTSLYYSHWMPLLEYSEEEK